MNSINLHLYDKAQHHGETIQILGLSDEHAYNHTTFFLSWLIKNNLMSDEIETDDECNPLKEYRLGRITINTLYVWWHCCLISDMLSQEGNQFAQAYFDFDKGQYLKDYAKYLQKNLPSVYHVPYTSENEATIHSIIDKRYKEWKTGRKWWQIWK